MQPRVTDELAAGGLREFGNPFLRCNQWLAPFFAEDPRVYLLTGLNTDGLDLVMHVRNHMMGAITSTHYSGDGRNIGIDIRQNFGR